MFDEGTFETVALIVVATIFGLKYVLVPLVRYILVPAIRSRRRSGPVLEDPGVFKKDLSLVAGLHKEAASLDSSESLDPKQQVDECIQATRSVSGYRSRLVNALTTHLKPPTDYFIWELEFAKPDRYHVFQTGWMQGIGEVYDQWITIGNEH